MSEAENIKVIKIPTRCKPIDDLLGGGIEAGTITQIYGEAGSGKTNLCLQLAIECVKSGKKVIFIDTEGFSPERFSQIAGENARGIAQDIFIFEPLTFEEQWSAIKDAERLIKKNVGLIIIDSLVSYYRFELDEERSLHLKRELANQLTHLLSLARKYNIGVAITNQVYTDVVTDELKAVGGTILEHLSKVIIKLEKLGESGKRRATIEKHRSRPEHLSAEFTITAKGLE
ncbi:MAG: DNA repair and recombination protein RadB [Halobacteria archaeon]